jgi:hypothetical protein
VTEPVSSPLSPKVMIDADGRRDQPEAVLAGPFPEAEQGPQRASKPAAGRP